MGRNADVESPLPTDESDDGLQHKQDSDGHTEKPSPAMSEGQAQEEANASSGAESATASSATEGGDERPVDSEDEGLHAVGVSSEIAPRLFV